MTQERKEGKEAVGSLQSHATIDDSDCIDPIIEHQLLHDKFMQRECRLAPLLPLPLNRTPVYTYLPTPL